MGLPLDNIPVSDIVKFLVIGAALLISFNIVSNYIIPFIKDKRYIIVKWWQRFQIISWLLFFGLFYVKMLQANIVITVILSVIILAIGFNYWRNIFAGILIRFSNQFRIGDIISTEFAQGQLRAINLSQTQLINERGELVVIPNSKIRAAVLKQLYQKNNLKTHSFSIESSTIKNSNEVYQLILNCPYISANQEIEVEKKQGNQYLIKVSVIDNSFIEKVNIYFETLLNDVDLSMH